MKILCEYSHSILTDATFLRSVQSKKIIMDFFDFLSEIFNHVSPLGSDKPWRRKNCFEKSCSCGCFVLFGASAVIALILFWRR